MAAILDFFEKAEKHQKKLTGKFTRAKKYLKIIRAGVYSYIIKLWS